MIKALLTLSLLTPVILFSQSYKFNRQIVMHIENSKAKQISTTNRVFFINITAKYVILKCMPSNSNDRLITDTLVRSGETKDKNFKKITTKDGSCLLIYNDNYITLATKEKQGKKTEVCFYNEQN